MFLITGRMPDGRAFTLECESYKTSEFFEGYVALIGCNGVLLEGPDKRLFRPRQWSIPASYIAHIAEGEPVFEAVEGGNVRQFPTSAPGRPTEGDPAEGHSDPVVGSENDPGAS